MKTCKDKTIELIKEITDICEREDIAYFISGDLALNETERRECTDTFSNGTIAVFARDVKRLTALLEQQENRCVESLANNSRFPGFYMRYMDPSTTFVIFNEDVYTYKTNSMGVNIEFICGRKTGTFKRKILSRLKRMWVSLNRPYYLEKSNEKRSFKEILAGIFFKAAACTPLMGKLYNAWVSEGSARTKMREISTVRGSTVKCEAIMFARTRKTRYLGEEFDTVKNLRGFTDAYFGEQKRLRPEILNICELDVPWQQYSKVIGENNIDLAKYQKDEQDYLRWRRHVYKPVEHKRDRYYAYMFLAEDRMLFYKEFAGRKKKRVKRLYSENKLNTVSKILSDYIEKINYYRKYKIGFCFDHEIFAIALSVMMRDAYRKSRTPEEFEKECKKLYSIVKRTNFRHFDSVKNVFWGVRKKSKTLKGRKNKIMNALMEEAEQYNAKFENRKRR